MKFQLILSSAITTKTLEFDAIDPVWIRQNDSGALLIDARPSGQKIAKLFLNKEKIYLKLFSSKLRHNGKKIEKKYIALKTGDFLSVELNKIEFRLISETPLMTAKPPQKKKAKKEPPPEKKLPPSKEKKSVSKKSSESKKTEKSKKSKKIKVKVSKTPSSKSIKAVEISESLETLETIQTYDNPIASSEATLVLPDLESLDLPSDSPPPRSQKTAKLQKVTKERPLLKAKSLEEPLKNPEIKPEALPAEPEKMELPKEPVVAKKIVRTATIRKVKAVGGGLAPNSLFSEIQKSQETNIVAKVPDDVLDSRLASDILPDAGDQTISPVADPPSEAEAESESISALMEVSDELEAALKSEFGDQLPEAGSAEDILASSVFHDKSDFHEGVRVEDSLASTQPQMDSSSDQALLLTQATALGSPKKFHSDESIKGNLFSAPPGETNIRKEVIRFSDLLSPSNLITTKNFKKDILLGRVLAERKLVSLTIINRFLLEIYNNKSETQRTLGQLLVISRHLKASDFASLHREVEELFTNKDYLEKLSEDYVIEWLGGAVRILIQLKDKFGSYPIISEIGAGGMGVVYKAVDVKGKKIIALKVLRNLTSETHMKRFQKEVKTTLKLTHPNIVPLYDVGEVDGIPFYTMKLIEGQLLNQYIAEKKLSYTETMRLGLKICRAVGYAHKHQILHRDLKPQNVLVNAEGEPYLMDFGVAKELDSDSVLTKSDETIGTPRYMSPEQIKGGRSLDASSDVYSLGMILYEMLNGRSPIKGETSVNIIYEILHTHVPPLRASMSDIPEPIDIIIQKSISKEKKDRYPTAQELADDIDRYLSHQPIEATLPGKGKIFKVLLLLVGIVLFLCFAGLFYLWSINALPFFKK